ncbi:helix-turn-helix domain-containing protein [Streptomyces sp. BK340]|uniref:helix-turn-helix domain-containing protein n=1 Tax=Streptomyces sp. BK340 TaxID=2572903 RepID=UPI0021BD7119|nr:helix-turn-helix domain-containing protein [Streptomyces sp. BK340]
MEQGLTSYEACRDGGINYCTGHRWRNGPNPSGTTKGAPPAQRPVAPLSVPPRYLREAERIYIASWLGETATLRAIAAELGRSPSTVSGEVPRNCTIDSRGHGHYRPHAAQARADARAGLARRPERSTWPAVGHGTELQDLRTWLPDRPEIAGGPRDGPPGPPRPPGLR